MKILLVLATLGVAYAMRPHWQYGNPGITARGKQSQSPSHLADSLRMLRSSIKVQSRGTRQSYGAPPRPSIRGSPITPRQVHGLSSSFRVPNLNGGYGRPSSSSQSAEYGSPSSPPQINVVYGAPSSPPTILYVTPSPSPTNYGAPSAPPSEAYGPPPPEAYGPPPSEIYGAPPSGPPSREYGAPPSGPPSGEYGAPPPGPPSREYGAPPSGPPSGEYGTPSNSPPLESYGEPSQSPSPNYGAPPSHFSAPLSIQVVPEIPVRYGAPFKSHRPIHNEVFNQNGQIQQTGGRNQGGQYGNNDHEEELEPIIHKHVFVHAAPEEPKKIRNKLKIRARKRPEKHYRILFIKAPSQESEQSEIDYSSLMAPQEHKTLVYVLLKKPEDKTEAIQAQIEAAIQTTTPSKPEVYFIKYKNDGEHGGYPGGEGGGGATGPSGGGEINNGDSSGSSLIEAN